MIRRPPRSPLFPSTPLSRSAYALADCDLLFIPRMTRLSHDEFTIPPRLYRLDPQQVAAIKDFLKSGKPILARSEEHTSELQSQSNLVCRLLLEKKKRTNYVS